MGRAETSSLHFFSFFLPFFLLILFRFFFPFLLCSVLSSRLPRLFILSIPHPAFVGSFLFAFYLSALLPSLLCFLDVFHLLRALPSLPTYGTDALREMKEEFKQTDGDRGSRPKIKRIRQLAARKSMM